MIWECFTSEKIILPMINGEHPVVAVEFLGDDISGKDVIIVDDIIESGTSIINTARELKKRGAGRVIVAATFGLFTDGLENFDKAYEEGLFQRIYITNLTYCSNELKKRVYYRMVNMSNQIAELIMALNHDAPVKELTDQSGLINNLLGR